MTAVFIDSRFNGPPGYGNGGYTCGVLGSLLGLEAEVTLRRPVPLEEKMRIEGGEESLEMFHGEELIAEAKTHSIELDAPPPVSYERAVAVSKPPPVDKHPFPRCFVCGPERGPGDGLRLFAGAVHDAEVVAAPWMPAKDLAGDDKFVRPEFMWASLDCPSGWASELLESGWPRNTALLGRMRVRLIAPVYAGEHCVVTARPIGGQRRAWDAASALYGGDGSLRAVSRTTWVYPAA